MGFIPIFLTLGGSAILFIMVVRQSMMNKKLLFEELMNKISESLPNFLVSQNSIKPTLESVKEGISKCKSQIKEQEKVVFENQILYPLRQAKLVRMQYNNLIKKRPYSFVAFIFNYKAI